MKGKLFCNHLALPPKQELLDILEKIEKELNITLIVTSGSRCQECNKLSGGKENSAHLTREAVDVVVPDSFTRYLIIKSAINNGITRIGIDFKRGFLHLDISKSLPNPVIFGY